MSELERKYEVWKSALLDTGRRNKMIDYKSSRLTTLKITEPPAEELFERLTVQERTLRSMRRVDRESVLCVPATDPGNLLRTYYRMGYILSGQKSTA